MTSPHKKPEKAPVSLDSMTGVPAALLESSLFQTLPAMLHSIDASGTIVEVNRRWLEILGYSRSEVIGRKSIDFLTPDSRNYAIENVLPEFFRSGRCVDVPYQMIARDGSILDVLLSATSECDACGYIVRSLAIVQDITARKRAERNHDAARRYAENLLRTASVIVLELDASGCLRQINETAERITGYSSAELQGADWFETLVPKQRYPYVWDAFECLLNEGGCDEFENPILTKSGQERLIHWHNSQVVECGRVVGTLSVGFDVTEQRETERRLEASESILREAQSVAQIGSWVFDYRRNELHWSDEIYRILDVDPATQVPSRKHFFQILHPDDRAEISRAYKLSMQLHQPYELRHRLLMPDGTLKFVRQRGEIAFAADGKPLRIVGTLQDVTLTVLHELALQESEERFRTIADFTYDWEYWQGGDGEILYISPSCQRITGYSQAEFVRAPDLLERIVHPDDQEAYLEHIGEAADGYEHQLDFRILTKGGEVRWIAHGCQPVIHNGKRHGRRVSNRDITELKEAEQLAQKLAYFDALTGLPNRRLLMDRLGQAVPVAKRQGWPMAVMFIDLDRFKYVNDTFGHEEGDNLLIEVARRFSGCIRAGDTIARSGGDEFVVLLPEIKQASDAVKVAEKMLTALVPPVCCGGVSLDASASIGIALLHPESTDTGADLMRQADMAMYSAKRAGRNGYYVY